MEYVQGLDVYMGNGKIDWARYYAQGYRFAYIKAGGLSATGVLYEDDMFLENWVGAKAAGFLRGNYWFNNFNKGNVSGQDEYYLSILTKVEPGELPECGDFESRAHSASGHQRQAFVDFLDSLKRATKREPLIYTGPYYWLDYGSPDQRWKRSDLWIAQYEVLNPFAPRPWGTWAGFKPPKPSDYDGWTFWQFSDHDGTGVKVDRNYFHGTYEDLLKWAGISAPPVEPPPPPPPEHPLTLEDVGLWIKHHEELHKLLPV